MCNITDAEMDEMDEMDEAIRKAIPTPGRVMAPCQWYGGKGNLAKKIVPLIPADCVYVEPYMGMASVFWHLAPRRVEVLNDLDGEVVNLFRVLQGRETFRELAHRLTWTLYSYDEFCKARRCESDDPVDRAWAFFVRQNQGFCGQCAGDGNWGRVFTSNRGMAGTANSWRGRLRLLEVWHDRLSRVQLDCRDALEIIRYWDTPETVFYCDPPYMAETRVTGKRDVYTHEADDAHHAALVETLLGIQGRAVLSGYDAPTYAPLTEAGWATVRIETGCLAAARNRGTKMRGAGAALEHAARTEVLWLSPRLTGGDVRQKKSGFQLPE